MYLLTFENMYIFYGIDHVHVDVAIQCANVVSCEWINVCKKIMWYYFELYHDSSVPS